MVHACLEVAAPLTTPHRDGWRAEPLLALDADLMCAEALTNLVRALALQDVTDATCNLLSSATLAISLKKTEEDMAALRALQGDQYMQPQRPMGMGGAISKRAPSCVLAVVDASVGVAVGPHQFAINAKGGRGMVSWVM